MGGSSKKVTVGYKYYSGVHFILIHGSADELNLIRVDERDLWQGFKLGGPITVNKEDLFGGESREGGVSGTLDFETGGITQPPNSYLLSKLGELVPAFRGVTGIVLRQFYLGMNPYLKKWDFRLKRIHKRHDGLIQWYDAKSEIKLSDFQIDQSFLFAIDTSGSMGTVVSAGITRLDIAKNAISRILDDLNTLRLVADVSVSVCICLWSASSSSMTRANITDADIAPLKAFLNSATASGGTNFERPFIQGNIFFEPSIGLRNRSLFFITDGNPDPSSTLANALVTGADILDKSSGEFNSDDGTAVDVYGINIDLSDTSYTEQVSNTGSVPVVNSSNSDELYQIIYGLMGSWGSMNPAHIIRECLTDPDWGLGYQDADIDNDSFVQAADTLYAEKLGMCIMWQRQTSIESFIDEVKRHINAELYVSRASGKFVLKLIRNDYNVGDLLVLNPSNLEKVANYKKPTFGELTNEITASYWDIALGDDATLTVQDIALAQQQGNTVATSINYPGFVTSSTASRAAQRDLKVLSTPLVSCTLYSTRVSEDLNMGDPFILNWPDYEIDNLVMRVTGLNFGDGNKKRITIQCVQDAFTMPDTALVPSVPPDWEDPTRAPSPIPLSNQVVFEVPYLELVQRESQTAVDTLLNTYPEVGYLGAAAARPSSALNARLYVNAGTGFEDSGLVDFCPFAILAEDIDEVTTVFPISDATEIESVTPESWFQMGSELMGVVSITPTSLTVKRAVLDTVPVKHITGETLLFWDAFAEGDSTEYVSSDSLDVKIAPVSGGGELSLDLAPTSTLVMDSRAIRPYPPGDFKVNGEYYPTAVENNVVLSWASRNRVQQTGGVLIGFTDSNVTPEDGTTYNVYAYNNATGTLEYSATGLTELEHVIEDLELFNVRVELNSERDGFTSYQTHSCAFLLFSSSNEIRFTGFYTPPVGTNVGLQFEGYPEGIPFMYFTRTQKSTASLPQVVKLKITNQNPSGATVNVSLGQDYHIVFDGLELDYTVVALAADHYRDEVATDNPVFMFSTRASDKGDTPLSSNVALNLGSQSGSSLEFIAGSGIASGASLITEGGTIDYMTAGSSSGGALRIHYANGTSYNNANAIKGETDFSVEIWFKTLGVVTGGSKILYAQDGIGSFTGHKIIVLFDPTSNVINFNISGGSTATHSVSGVAEISDGFTHHVVVTRGAEDRLTIYVDGELIAQTTYTFKNYIEDAVTASQFGNGITSTAALNYAADFPAIYHTELSEARVLAHYNAGSAGNPISQIPYFTEVYKSFGEGLTASGDYSVTYTKEGFNITEMLITRTENNVSFLYDGSID